MSVSYSSQHLRSLWKADFDTFMALFCGSSVEGVGCCQCPGLLEIPCHWVLPLWKTLSVCCCCQPPLLDPESLLAASLSADGFKGSNWPWRWNAIPCQEVSEPIRRCVFLAWQNLPYPKSRSKPTAACPALPNSTVDVHTRALTCDSKEYLEISDALLWFHLNPYVATYFTKQPQKKINIFIQHD